VVWLTDFLALTLRSVKKFHPIVKGEVSFCEAVYNGEKEVEGVWGEIDF
jgi:hypothetical protein